MIRVMNPTAVKIAANPTKKTEAKREELNPMAAWPMGASVVWIELPADKAANLFSQVISVGLLLFGGYLALFRALTMIGRE